MEIKGIKILEIAQPITRKRILDRSLDFSTEASMISVGYLSLNTDRPLLAAIAGVLGLLANHYHTQKITSNQK